MRWMGTRYADCSDKRGVGCDCAGLPKGVMVESGFLEDFKLPYWDPQQWLKKNYEDKQYLTTLLTYADEIQEWQVLPADFVLYRVAHSFTHGGIIIRWPDFVLHSVKGPGVIGSHGINEGFLRGRKRRFFRMKRWAS